MKYLGDMLIKVGQMEQVIYKVMENHFYFPLLKIVNIYVSKINKSYMAVKEVQPFSERDSIYIYILIPIKIKKAIVIQDVVINYLKDFNTKVKRLDNIQQDHNIFKFKKQKLLKLQICEYIYGFYFKIKLYLHL